MLQSLDDLPQLPAAAAEDPVERAVMTPSGALPRFQEKGVAQLAVKVGQLQRIQEKSLLQLNSKVRPSPPPVKVARREAPRHSGSLYRNTWEPVPRHVGACTVTRGSLRSSDTKTGQKFRHTENARD